MSEELKLTKKGNTNPLFFQFGFWFTNGAMMAVVLAMIVLRIFQGAIDLFLTLIR